MLCPKFKIASKKKAALSCTESYRKQIPQLLVSVAILVELVPRYL